jgi:two-component system sensor histidine kinase RegB
VSLYLLQVVLGAILLGSRSTIAIVALTSLCFALLTGHYRALDLPPVLARHSIALNVAGAWICFALIAILLVLFVTRINRNLSARDQHLAALRQHAAEEDHIVRMGLLASGAAHELGTPLASLAVILGDWKRLPVLADQPDLLDDVAEMQAELDRCKAIVTGVLLAAGEVRGEAPKATTLATFVNDVAAAWARAHPATRLDVGEDAGAHMPIVADTALQQILFNVLDNAAEASPDRIALSVGRTATSLTIAVRDFGPGFTTEQLQHFGRPYTSSKGRLGSGLGLFLVVNVMRKLGGSVEAVNLAGGGARVALTLPLAALALPEATYG